MSEKHGLAALALLEESGNLTRLGLRLPAHCSWDQYEAMGLMFGSWNESLKWAFGDYIVGGEGLFGETAYQASDGLGLSVETRQQYANVALRIPIERRRPELSWSHHRSVSTIYRDDPEKQDAWLAAAVEHGWTKDQMEEAIKGLPNDPPETPQEPEDIAADQVVVEVVIAAAERVWAAAQRSDADHYIIDAGPMEDLANALGAEVTLL